MFVVGRDGQQIGTLTLEPRDDRWFLHTDIGPEWLERGIPAALHQWFTHQARLRGLRLDKPPILSSAEVAFWANVGEDTETQQTTDTSESAQAPRP
jgi:hypothetical protein